MAEDDYLPEHERRLLRRHRKKTVRASTAETVTNMAAQGAAPEAAGEPDRVERTTGKIQSFRARALAEYVDEQKLVPDLTLLLEGVLAGARDERLAATLGTDPDGLRDLEQRFRQQVGRSVYVAAVQVVNRAARLRFETIG